MDIQSRAIEFASPVDVGALARRGTVALVLAWMVNVAIVFGAEFAEIAPLLEPLSVGPVLVVTTLGVVGATVVYGLLSRSRENPDRLFTGVAAVVLVLSLIPDVTYAPTIADATTAGVALLAVMHVTTAVVCVAVLTDRIPWP
jgi:hypothetical protein